MKTQRICLPLANVALFLFLLGLATSACTVKYVADYDASVMEEIVKVSKAVDMFYAQILETPEGERKYEKFKAGYINIEGDLYGLRLKNEIRPLNKESARQTEIAQELWQQDMTDHKTNDSVGDFIAKRHREQFRRIFVAMARGERAKVVATQ